MECIFHMATMLQGIKAKMSIQTLRLSEVGISFDLHSFSYSFLYIRHTLATFFATFHHWCHQPEWSWFWFNQKYQMFDWRWLWCWRGNAGIALQEKTRPGNVAQQYGLISLMKCSGRPCGYYPSGCYCTKPKTGNEMMYGLLLSRQECVYLYVC